MKIRTKSFLKNFLTPDLQKNSKNLEISKKKFFLETTKRVLIHIGNNISDSFCDF